MSIKHTQDKDYLARNLSECAVKLENCQDTLRRTQDQLERTKQAREELYEKYAASRDEARLSYERRLQTELDRIRLVSVGIMLQLMMLLTETLFYVICC